MTRDESYLISFPCVEANFASTMHAGIEPSEAVVYPTDQVQQRGHQFAPNLISNH